MRPRKIVVHCAASYCHGHANGDQTLAGARVLIDPVSLDFLAGAEIDFTDDLIGQAFKVNNPNATSSCGCGTSFSV